MAVKADHVRLDEAPPARTTPRTIVCGECFTWALNNLPMTGAKLVHATVRHPWSGKLYQHAWIEKRGRVYDWQSVEQGLGPGAKGWARKQFYVAYKPTKMRVYNRTEASRRALRHRHSGPW